MKISTVAMFATPWITAAVFAVFVGPVAATFVAVMALIANMWMAATGVHESV